MIITYSNSDNINSNNITKYTDIQTIRINTNRNLESQFRAIYLITHSCFPALLFRPSFSSPAFLSPYRHVSYCSKASNNAQFYKHVLWLSPSSLRR